MGGAKAGGTAPDLGLLRQPGAGPGLGAVRVPTGGRLRRRLVVAQRQLFQPGHGGVQLGELDHPVGPVTRGGVARPRPDGFGGVFAGFFQRGACRLGLREPGSAVSGPRRLGAAGGDGLPRQGLAGVVRVYQPGFLTGCGGTGELGAAS